MTAIVLRTASGNDISLLCRETIESSGNILVYMCMILDSSLQLVAIKETAMIHINCKYPPQQKIPSSMVVLKLGMGIIDVLYGAMNVSS